MYLAEYNEMANHLRHLPLLLSKEGKVPSNPTPMARNPNTEARRPALEGPKAELELRFNNRWTAVWHNPKGHQA